MAQTFPNHFHEYFVIGLIEAGERFLIVNNHEIMQDIVHEVFDCYEKPQFRGPVQYRTDLAPVFCSLHDSIMENGPELEKEELFLLFMLSETHIFEGVKARWNSKTSSM